MFHTVSCCLGAESKLAFQPETPFAEASQSDLKKGSSCCAALSLTAGCLTVESPVGDWRHGDTALEHGAVREKKEGGEKSSVGLEGKATDTAADQPRPYQLIDR